MRRWTCDATQIALNMPPILDSVHNVIDVVFDSSHDDDVESAVIIPNQQDLFREDKDADLSPNAVESLTGENCALSRHKERADEYVRWYQ